MDTAIAVVVATAAALFGGRSQQLAYQAAAAAAAVDAVDAIYCYYVYI